MQNIAYNISFTKYNDSSVIMHVNQAKDFIIGNSKKDIIIEFFNGNDEKLKKALYEKFLNFKNNDEKIASIQDFQYKKTILSSRQMDNISSIFSFLFKKNVLLFTIISTFCIDMYFYFIAPPHFVSSVDIDLSWFIIAFVFIFHEIGHSTACKVLGGKGCEIGFGITMLMPALYADVSPSWYLDKKKRMVVNFGGIYFQNLFACFFLILSLFIGNVNMFYISKTISLSTVYQLFPYYKSDGYWILTDLVEEPRLYRKAQHVFFTFLRHFGIKLDKRTIFLFTYYTFLEVVIIWFIYMTFFRYGDYVKSLPSYLWSIVKGICNADMSDIHFSFGYIVVILALYFTGKVLFTNLKLYFHSDD